MEIFGCLLTILLLGVIGVLLYKYRFKLKRYLNDPKYGSGWSPSRETVLKRCIEDAEAELAWLANTEKEE